MFLLAVSVITLGHTTEFSNLDSIVVERHETTWYGGQAVPWSIIIRYDKSIAKILNRPSTDMKGCELADMISTKVDRALPDQYIIQYSPGPSVDPYYRIKKGSTVVGHLSGGELAIPGDGYMYVSSRNGKMFRMRQKFKIVEHKLVEIEQPYYYVGLGSVTGSEVALYADTLLENPVVTLPQGSAVTVLVNRGHFYLVTTPWGLTGWVKILPGDDGRTVRDIFFLGD